MSVISKLPEMKKIAASVVGEDKADAFLQSLSTIDNMYDFQHGVIIKMLFGIEQKCTDGVVMTGVENIDTSKGHLFLTNHRDIVLDSALLNVHLALNNLPTTQIAIGNNLLAYPWIERVVRMNKSFIVKRDGTIKEQLLISKHLSAYVRHIIAKCGESAWMAQREGRAKNSDDRTQSSIIKMLNMSGEGTFSHNFNELSVVPIAINYEFDPCDWLKAKEMQLKRDDASYKKSKADDVLSMKTGIMGYKGRVSFVVCKPLECPAEWDTLSRNEQVDVIIKEIDSRLHSSYQLYPNNYVAAALLTGDASYAEKFNDADRKRFCDYVEQQIARIDIENKDVEFLRARIYEMYANPAINQKAALGR